MSSNLNCWYVVDQLFYKLLEEHLYTLLHTQIMREPDTNICWGGGGLTGYKCETCEVVEQAWSDGLNGHPFRNTVSG